MSLLHPRRASKVPALCKRKALKTGRKINYCKAWFELIFLLDNQTVSVSVGVGIEICKHIAIVIGA